jgi:hypothetical protein
MEVGELRLGKLRLDVAWSWGATVVPLRQIGITNPINHDGTPVVCPPCIRIEPSREQGHLGILDPHGQRRGQPPSLGENGGRGSHRTTTCWEYVWACRLLRPLLRWEISPELFMSFLPRCSWVSSSFPLEYLAIDTTYKHNTTDYHWRAPDRETLTYRPLKRSIRHPSH